MAVTSIEDLFVNELRDIYSAEKQLTRALPRMAKAAKHPELRDAFESHLEETRGQIERLDQVFEQLDLPKRAKKCEAMEGLIEEAPLVQRCSVTRLSPVGALVPQTEAGDAAATPGLFPPIPPAASPAPTAAKPKSSNDARPADNGAEKPTSPSSGTKPTHE